MVATMPVTMVMTILPLLWLLLFLPLFLRILVFRLLSNSTLIERTPAAAKYLLSIHSVFFVEGGDFNPGSTLPTKSSVFMQLLLRISARIVNVL